LRHNWTLECHGNDVAYFCDFLPLAAEDISQSRLFLFRIRDVSQVPIGAGPALFDVRVAVISHGYIKSSI
jgi:hypothetical protein